VFLLVIVTAIGAKAQKFKTLANFSHRTGAEPEAALVQGADGNFFGTAIGAGDHESGTVFKMTPSGRLTILYTFCTQPNCADGAEPYGSLIQATDGNFYGTTYSGGSGNCRNGVIPGCGTIFKITPAGNLATLYNFCSQPGCPDGGQPLSGLIQVANGSFYGTTSFGPGTVFRLSPKGKLTTLHLFGWSEGAVPASRQGLIQGTNGDLYGTTAAGGLNGRGGTVFRITPGGMLTTLYNFCSQLGCTDGENPWPGVIQIKDGNLYGTTVFGGIYGVGTVFQLTPEGTLTTLHSFCTQSPNCGDGAIPYARLIQAADENFYSTTYSNGPHGGGTIFKITASGTLTTLHSFCARRNCRDGAFSPAGLVQGINGIFYGTTGIGGVHGDGTVFRLDVDLDTFVVQ